MPYSHTNFNCSIREFLFGWAVYHFLNHRFFQIFCILSLLSIMNRFTLEAYQRHFRFARWGNERLHYDVDFAQKNMFSDEAHFHHSVFVCSKIHTKPYRSHTCIMGECLMRLVKRRHHWPMFTWKWGGHNNYGQCRHLTYHDNRFFCTRCSWY